MIRGQRTRAVGLAGVLLNKAGQAVLRLENKVYPVIRLKGELEIFGVVVGQLRKYG